MTNKLYVISSIVNRKDYILAEDLQDVIKIWKQFYKTEDDPKQIELLANHVIGRLETK